MSWYESQSDCPALCCPDGRPAAHLLPGQGSHFYARSRAWAVPAWMIHVAWASQALPRGGMNTHGSH